MRCKMQVIIILTLLVNAHTLFATDFHTVKQDFKKWLKKSTFILYFLYRFMCHISYPRIQFPHIWQWNISQANDDNDGPAK